MGRLDLDEYEDLDHVLDQADNATTSAASKAAPLDPAQVAWALAHPDDSQRAMYERFRVGFPKIRRVQGFAREVLTELQQLGFAVCNGATVQQEAGHVGP